MTEGCENGDKNIRDYDALKKIFDECDVASKGSVSVSVLITYMRDSMSLYGSSEVLEALQRKLSFAAYCDGEVSWEQFYDESVRWLSEVRLRSPQRNSGCEQDGNNNLDKPTIRITRDALTGNDDVAHSSLEGDVETTRRENRSYLLVPEDRNFGLVGFLNSSVVSNYSTSTVNSTSRCEFPNEFPEGSSDVNENDELEGRRATEDSVPETVELLAKMRRVIIENADLRETLQRDEETIDALQQRLAEAERISTQQSEKCGKLAKENGEQRELVVAMEKKIDIFTATIEQLEKVKQQKVRLEKSIKEMESERQKINSEYETTTRMNRELSKRIVDCKFKLDEIQTLRDEDQRQISSLREDNERWRNAHEALVRTNQRLEDAVKELEIELSESRIYRISPHRCERMSSQFSSMPCFIADHDDDYDEGEHGDNAEINDTKSYGTDANCTVGKSTPCSLRDELRATLSTDTKDASTQLCLDAVHHHEFDFTNRRRIASLKRPLTGVEGFSIIEKSSEVESSTLAPPLAPSLNLTGHCDAWRSRDKEYATSSSPSSSSSEIEKEPSIAIVAPATDSGALDFRNGDTTPISSKEAPLDRVVSFGSRILRRKGVVSKVLPVISAVNLKLSREDKRPGRFKFSFSTEANPFDVRKLRSSTSVRNFLSVDGTEKTPNSVEKYEERKSPIRTNEMARGTEKDSSTIVSKDLGDRIIVPTDGESAESEVTRASSSSSSTSASPSNIVSTEVRNGRVDAGLSPRARRCDRENSTESVTVARAMSTGEDSSDCESNRHDDEHVASGLTAASETLSINSATTPETMDSRFGVLPPLASSSPRRDEPVSAIIDNNASSESRQRCIDQQTSAFDVKSYIGSAEFEREGRKEHRKECERPRGSLSDGEGREQRSNGSHSSINEIGVTGKEEEGIEIFPNLSDDRLLDLGLSNHRGSLDVCERIAEEDLERKYTALSLGLETDRVTLERRVSLGRRHRDQAERNLDAEVEKTRGDVQALAPLCVDRESVERVERVKHQLEMIAQCAHRVSCTAELLGAIHQEQRVSRAALLADRYLRSLRARCEKLAAELAETKRILLENNIVVEENPSELGDEVPRVRYRGLPANNRTTISKRRASIAAISRPLLPLGIPPELTKDNGRSRTSVTGRIPARRPSLSYEAQKWDHDNLDRTDSSSSSMGELREIFEQAESRRTSREENNNDNNANENPNNVRVGSLVRSQSGNFTAINSEMVDPDARTDPGDDSTPIENVEKASSILESQFRQRHRQVMRTLESYATRVPMVWCLFFLASFFLGYYSKYRMTTECEAPYKWWSIEEMLKKYQHVNYNQPPPV